jgi:hypothetical protein
MKKIIKKIIHRVGFDSTHFNHPPAPFGLFLAGINNFGIDLVVDLATNTDLFSMELREARFTGRMLQFDEFFIRP